jgi:PAS domain-containing protein
MVTKEDTSEAYAQVKVQGWILGGTVFLVITLFLVIGRSILRRGIEIYELELNKAENTAARIRQSYEMLFDMANDIIVVVDENGLIVDVNDRAVKCTQMFSGSTRRTENLAQY